LRAARGSFVGIWPLGSGSPAQRLRKTVFGKFVQPHAANGQWLLRANAEEVAESTHAGGTHGWYGTATAASHSRLPHP